MNVGNSSEMTNRAQRRGFQDQLPAQFRAQREAGENKRLLRELDEAEATNQRKLWVISTILFLNNIFI